MKSTLVNCTPHPITLLDSNNQEVMKLEKGVVVPRVAQTTKNVGQLNGIAITETSFGEVVDLPEPQDNTYLIVPRLVMSACPKRTDLLVPNELVRDDLGGIIGCKSLARN